MLGRLARDAVVGQLFRIRIFRWFFGVVAAIVFFTMVIGVIAAVVSAL